MLKIHNLCTNFFTYRGIVKAVDGLSLELKEGEVLGLVGESGCGKSVTLLSILGLVPYPGRITGGEVWFEGENLLKKTSKEMRYFRGNKISMIFQDPMTTLNPVFRVGEQIRESLSVHNYKKISKKTEKEKVLKLIKDVGLPSPEQIYQQYPHQLSGGMQQRILIAIALSCTAELRFPITREFFPEAIQPAPPATKEFSPWAEFCLPKAALFGPNAFTASP